MHVEMAKFDEKNIFQSVDAREGEFTFISLN